MSASSMVRRLVVACVALAAISCTDQPSQPGAGGPTARLQIVANLTASAAEALVVEVTAPEFPEPFLFNIPVSNGIATGSIVLPAGSQRTVTLRAYDARGVETHRGVRTIDVVEGNNPALSITMVPLTGNVPIEARVGSVVVVIVPENIVLRAGQALNFTAVVVDSQGIRPDAPLLWASSNPGRLVMSGSLALTRDTGDVIVGATLGGYGAQAVVRVLPGLKLDDVVVQHPTLSLSGGTAFQNVDVSVRSAGAGISGVALTVTPPAPRPQQQCFATLVAGTARTGTWRCTMALQPGAAANGAWSYAVSVVDDAGLGAGYSAANLSAMGMDAGFALVDGPAVDDTAPTLAALDLSKTTVSVGSGPDTVLVRVRLTTSGSGASFFNISMVSPTETRSRACGTANLTLPDSGTTLDGWWRCRLIFPRDVEGGTWRIGGLSLGDSVGNRRTVPLGDVIAAGLPHEVQVTSPTPDLAAPAISAIVREADTLVVSGAVQEAGLLVTATDPAGIALTGTTTRMTLVSPGGTVVSNNWSIALASGTATNGVVRIRVRIPTMLEQGTWTIQSLVMVDLHGNTRILTTADLQAAGFPATFEVVNP